MSDVIKLLPDAVANQIAAGEVIQRPASAVKELLENSVDAGSTDIQLIIKDAGRSLIQVTDNGKGMSVTDARLCFERHATSKISQATDLFSIKTMGFRGEAMASIAAVAQVEMKTRPHQDELGTRLVIEGSEVKVQEPCQCAPGTNISVKNLFYNIPARRNFLKSNQVEFRHILDEFMRVAMAFPGVAFSLYNNGQEVYKLEATTLRQRITSLFGAGYNERLVPVEESTGVLSLSGFIGKPAYARKTRGEQFFFVNNRFIRSPYLHHAVTEAFDDLLPPESFPGYFIFLTVDPAVIDINIHPTKTEVKFEDERSVYAILRAAVKQSLGKYHIAPSLDFERETSFDIPLGKTGVRQPEIQVNTNYNPFRTSAPNGGFHMAESSRSSSIAARTEAIARFEAEQDTPSEEVRPAFIHLQHGYFLTTLRKGVIIIDQNRAHERVLFERFLTAIGQNKPVSQQELFPRAADMSKPDLELLKELLPDLKKAGFDLEVLDDGVMVNGTPAGCDDQEPGEVLEQVLENYRREKAEPALHIPKMLAHTLARKLAMPRNRKLQSDEMSNLTDELFACEAPYVAPDGKPTIIKIGAEELEKRFQR